MTSDSVRVLNHVWDPYDGDAKYDAIEQFDDLLEAPRNAKALGDVMVDEVNSPFGRCQMKDLPSECEVPIVINIAPPLNEDEDRWTEFRIGTLTVSLSFEIRSEARSRYIQAVAEEHDVTIDEDRVEELNDRLADYAEELQDADILDDTDTDTATS